MKKLLCLDWSSLFLASFLLFGLPTLIFGLRQSPTQVAEFLNQHLSLSHVPITIQDKLAHVLFVPLGAAIVVFVRLTLGLRMLGPYRSLLLAIAFQIVGIAFGLTVLILSILTTYATHSIIRSFKMPFFGTSLMSLSTIALLMVGTVISCQWIHADGMLAIAYFPVVVLCLIADAYLRSVKEDGLTVGICRGMTTACVAAVLSIISSVPILQKMQIMYPELLLAQMGLILIVSKAMNWRLFGTKKANDDLDEAEYESQADLSFINHSKEDSIKSVTFRPRVQLEGLQWKQPYDRYTIRNTDDSYRFRALNRPSVINLETQFTGSVLPHRDEDQRRR